VRAKEASGQNRHEPERAQHQVSFAYEKLKIGRQVYVLDLTTDRNLARHKSIAELISRKPAMSSIISSDGSLTSQEKSCTSLLCSP